MYCIIRISNYAVQKNIYPFTSAIEAPKLICKTLPFGVTNAGTDLTPVFSASSIRPLSLPK